MLQTRVPAGAEETVARMESRHEGIAGAQGSVTATLGAWRATAGEGGRQALAAEEVTVLPLWLVRAVYGVLMPHHRDIRPHLEADLESLRDVFTTGAVLR